MTQRTQEDIIQYLENGKIKEASARVELSAGGTENFVIKSPADVEDVVSILNFTISNTATVSLDFYNQTNIDDSGTDMYIMNSKSTELCDTDQVFEFGGSYSGGTKKGEDLFGAGAKNRAVGAKSESIRRIVSDGDAVRYEFTNEDTSNSQQLAVKILFYEK